VLITGLIGAVFTFVGWIVSFFPKGDTSAIVSALQGWRQVLGSVLQFDGAFPIHETIDAVGLYVIVVGFMQGGTVIRKIWSLVSGGGGA